MLTLSFTFLAGRYHATPWDQHVNEGAVPWPPGPWRILRALISTWHHKIKLTSRFAEETLSGLIESLASELPEYVLPSGSHAHTRHYMPQFAIGETSLVFDAFVALKRDDPLMVTWPSLDLAPDQTVLLDELLLAMGYLGRAESWVEARRLSGRPDASESAKCRAGTDVLDADTGELRRETVTLFTAVQAAAYRELRDRFVTDKRVAKRLGATLPARLLDALSVETGLLRKHGWNRPPAARAVTYIRPLNALHPTRITQAEVVPRITTLRLVLTGKPLPPIAQTVRLGELCRRAVMSQAKRLLGEDAIPPIFSGHGLPKDNRHNHAFYLPWDSNGDGRLDRILIHVPAGMDAFERRVAEQVGLLRSRDGGEWPVALEAAGSAEVGGLMGCRAVVWQSVTPYLHPWHAKRNLGIREQIQRECRERGFPQPLTLDRIDELRVADRGIRPVQFERTRGKRDLTQPDRLGSFWRIQFPVPVQGPLALGFGCHFGLGLFTASG